MKVASATGKIQEQRGMKRGGFLSFIPLSYRIRWGYASLFSYYLSLFIYGRLWGYRRFWEDRMKHSLVLV